MSVAADPFGVDRLRETVLDGWRASPTRLREDAATESDLVRGGYRDRVLTELAQNAADAAARRGEGSRIRVSHDGAWLSVANTGAPLDRAGVESLTALRASAKTTPDVAAVGRFGVGFTAVAAVADEVEIRSCTGGLAFSRDRAREAWVERGGDAGAAIPLLRVAWPTAARPPRGFDTEVRLRLRPEVDPGALLEAFRAEAVDLLLELDAVSEIDVDGEVVRRERAAIDDHRAIVRIADRSWHEYRGTDGTRWLAPTVDGRARPADPDVLRAPTRSDEELSMPALLIADVAMAPDRRRVLPGTPVAPLAVDYGEFVAGLDPRDRTSFVPVPGFARSAVDAELREAVLDVLRSAPWLPAASGPDAIAPRDAYVASPSGRALVDALGDVVDGWVDPDVIGDADATALASVGVRRVDLAGVVELVAGLARPPQWWGGLYAALDPLATHATDRDALAALPVPLSDGRTVTGPRTVVVPQRGSAAHDLTSGSVPWARVVHPAAADPLLERLGAGSVSDEDLLSDPALLALVERLDEEDPDGEALGELVGTVLALARDVRDPISALGVLPLPDAHGDRTPADQLLLPEAALWGVLVDDAPFGSVEPRLAERVGTHALRVVGVGDGFTVLDVVDPTGPGHDLPDEERWWDALEHDPERLSAIRDLDLVADDRWEVALDLVTADPACARTLVDRAGYTAWWLRAHATVDGVRLGAWRSPDDTRLEGLLDPCARPDADRLRACLFGAEPESVADVQLLVDRLAEPGRTPSAAVIAVAHDLLADADVDPDEIALPDRVRTVDGGLCAAADALVGDVPWAAAVVPFSRWVPVDPARARALADLLDLRTVSDAGEVTVLSAGRATEWGREPVVVASAAGRAMPTVPLVVHDDLTIRWGDDPGAVSVPWCVDGHGVVHATLDGLPAAFAGVGAVSSDRTHRAGARTERSDR